MSRYNNVGDLSRFKEYSQYGVRFSGLPNVTTGTRIGSAIGMVANAHKGSYNALLRNDFDSKRPWSDIKTAKIAADGSIVAWLGDPTFDSATGEWMCKIPKYYVKMISPLEFYISPDPDPGFVPHPDFIRPNGTLRSHVWRSVVHAGLAAGGTKLTSQPDTVPLVNQTMAQFRAKAAAVGTGWQQADVWNANSLQLLMLVEFANTNMQAVIGRGVCDLQYSASHVATVAEAAVNRIIVANATAALYSLGQYVDVGTTQGGRQVAQDRKITSIDTYDANNKAITLDGATFNVTVGNIIYNVGQPVPAATIKIIGNHSGYIGVDGKSAAFYRGMVCWGNDYYGLEGALCSNASVYVINNPALYGDATTAAWIDTGLDVQAATDGYVGTMSSPTMFPTLLIPTALGGGTASGWCDYFTYPRYAVTVPRAGGSFLYGSSGGPFAWYCYAAPAYTNINFGALLLYKTVN